MHPFHRLFFQLIAITLSFALIYHASKHDNDIDHRHYLSFGPPPREQSSIPIPPPSGDKHEKKAIGPKKPAPTTIETKTVAKATHTIVNRGQSKPAPKKAAPRSRAVSPRRSQSSPHAELLGSAPPTAARDIKPSAASPSAFDAAEHSTVNNDSFHRVDDDAISGDPETPMAATSAHSDLQSSHRPQSSFPTPTSQPLSPAALIEAQADPAHSPKLLASPMRAEPAAHSLAAAPPTDPAFKHRQSIQSPQSPVAKSPKHPISVKSHSPARQTKRPTIDSNADAAKPAPPAKKSWRRFFNFRNPFRNWRKWCITPSFFNNKSE